MAWVRSCATLGIILAAVSASGVSAQSIEPRAYAAAPVGTNFAVLAYSEARGALPMDPALPVSDIDLKMRGAVAAYVRSFDLLGKSAKFDLVVPYGELKGSATFRGEPIERDVSGFGDPAARLTVLFHGAPAMTAQEFRNYRQDLLLGGSVQVFIPIGQYDRDKLLNLSGHRWAVKPELGASKSWGRWTIEAAAGATFFGDNEDFLGTHRRSQKPIYSVQSHLIHNFASGSWIAANLSWFGGGRTSIDGISDKNLQKNWRAGLILAVPLDPRLSVKANGSSGVSARTGNNFDLYGLALQYRWGAGS